MFNTFIQILVVLATALSYAALVALTPSRLVQALGLPMVGLLGLAVVEFAKNKTMCVHLPLRLALLFFLIFLSTWFCTFLVARIDKQTLRFAAEESHPDRRTYERLRQQQSWMAIVKIFNDGRWQIADPGTLETVAIAYGKLGDQERSEKIYQQAIMTAASDVQLRYRYARLLEKNGKLIVAAGQYERIFNINDFEPDPHFAYGVLAVKMGNRVEAIQHLRKAIELYPDGSPWQGEAKKLLDRLLREEVKGNGAPHLNRTRR